MKILDRESVLLGLPPGDKRMYVDGGKLYTGLDRHIQKETTKIDCGLSGQDLMLVP